MGSWVLRVFLIFNLMVISSCNVSYFHFNNSKTGSITYGDINGVYNSPLSVTPAIQNLDSDIINCSISPALPAGLTINSLNCIISGTPEESLSSTTFTVSAVTSKGTIDSQVLVHIPVAPFITTWNTVHRLEDLDNSIMSGHNINQNDFSITLPLSPSCTYDFTVDWGDGTPSEDINAWNDLNKSHTYLVAGTYDITMTGNIGCLNFDFDDEFTYDYFDDPYLNINIINAASFLVLDGDASKLTDVKQWGSNAWTTTKKMFFLADNLTATTATDKPNLKHVTDMSHMFELSNFSANINHWNTSTVTNMSYLFHKNRSFIGELNQWDVSQVTNMSYMFFMTNFDQSLNNWDTSKVTDMSYMFSTAAFNSNISNWDTSNVTNFDHMFWDAIAFNQDITRWNTSKVVSFFAMFGSNSFNYFTQDISSWDTSNATNMSHMFCRAQGFNANISMWNTSKVTDMSRMFHEAYSFNQNIGNWDTSLVTNMIGMLYGTSSFDQNLSSWNVDSVTDRESFNDNGILSIPNWPPGIWWP